MADTERLNLLSAVASKLVLEQGYATQTSLGKALIEGGHGVGSTARSVGNHALGILLRNGLLKATRDGRYVIPDGMVITDSGDVMVGVPTKVGARREDLFKLRQVAASYGRMLAQAEDDVHRVNPGLAESFSAMFREVSKQVVMLELILEVTE